MRRSADAPPSPGSPAGSKASQGESSLPRRTACHATSVTLLLAGAAASLVALGANATDASGSLLQLDSNNGTAAAVTAAAGIQWTVGELNQLYLCHAARPHRHGGTWAPCVSPLMLPMAGVLGSSSLHDLSTSF